MDETTRRKLKEIGIAVLVGAIIQALTLLLNYFIQFQQDGITELAGPAAGSLTYLAKAARRILS